MSLEVSHQYRAEVNIIDREESCYNRVFSSPQEFENFIQTYGQTIPGWSHVRAAVSPVVITSPWDFLFPIFKNLEFQTRSRALKFFAIPLDIATLPIRFLTAPIQALYNSRKKKSPHPLNQLIGPALNSDVIGIHYNLSQEKREVFYHNNELTKSFYQNYNGDGLLLVALKRIPGKISPVVAEEYTYAYGTIKEDKRRCTYKMTVNQTTGIQKIKVVAFKTGLLADEQVKTYNQFKNQSPQNFSN